MHMCDVFKCQRAGDTVHEVSSLPPQWVPWIKFRSSGLCGKHFYPLSHVISPVR